MHPAIKQLSGFLNTDDAPEIIGSTHHKFALNGRFRGVGNNMRFETVQGTNLIPNPYLPAGSNECIGAFYDDLKQRIFWFNYNSNGSHGIYQYLISTQSIARIALVGYNTDGDIFGFTLNGSIYNVKMLYGDTEQGDTLYFNNSQKQPCEINIDRALSGGYGTIKRTFIDVIKAPAPIPPVLTYGNDITVTINNLRKLLFKFKIRFVYANKEKSVWSSQGELPLPVNYADTAIDKDPTKNCRVDMVIPTGESDVVKIEIACATSNGNTYSDYFLVAVLDKAASSIPSNDITTFRFYNNQAYTNIDLIESIQLQDLVPLEANALEFLNGNVPVYGGILEGFNPIVIDAATTSTNTPKYTTQPPYIYTSNQSGDSGFGTGNIHVILIGAVAIGNVYNIYTTNNTLTYIAAVATTTDVINGLAAAAFSAGFTVVSSDTENLVIIKTGESLQRVFAVPILIAVSDSFVYDWNSRYSYAVVYFDKAGRTNGALTNVSIPFQTANYTETAGVPNIPKIQFSINSRPPDWAYYYQIVRTKNLSKLTTFYWISDRTFKDTTYAYIGIENLNTYIKDNNIDITDNVTSSSFLAYSFSPNDRVRFLKVVSGSVNTVYAQEDFEILSQVFNPTINGVIEEGQFLKIALPATSGTFDFGTSDFYNYFINLYSPAQSVANGLDLYYEFGARYTIGNPTLTTRYHQGMLQNQTSNLSQPATFEFTQGDYYLRDRTINTGTRYEYQIYQGGQVGAARFTLGLDFISATFNEPNITTGSSPLLSLAGFDLATNTNRAILKIATGTFTFRLQGSISVAMIDSQQTFRFYLETNTGVITNLVPNQNMVIGDNVFTFDVMFQLTSGQRLFAFGYSDNDFNNLKQFSLTTWKITREQPFTQTIIDANFSDFFQSAVNSNATAGRSYVVDENAQQVFNPTIIRWGLAYQPNTNINQTNRFREINFDEIDRSKGQIQRFKVRDRILRVFQERACGQLGVYAKFLQDSGNTNILTTTDDIITKNNVQYYEGMFGLGNQVTSLVSSKIDDYFVDPVRGYQVRLGGNGLTAISELYKGQFFIQPLFIPYNNYYTRLNGGMAKVLGYYDYAEEQYVAILQGGTYNGNTIADYTFSFNEKRNAYCSFYEFFPEWAISANDITYSFKNGQLYIHNDEGDNRKFYTKDFFASIILVFNEMINIKKTFMSLSYQANDYWLAQMAGDILTSQLNAQTGKPQISQLKQFNFDIQEGLYYAGLQKDMNSRANMLDAWYNGDYLKGVWLLVKLTALNNNNSYLYLPTLNISPSPRN